MLLKFHWQIEKYSLKLLKGPGLILTYMQRHIRTCATILEIIVTGLQLHINYIDSTSFSLGLIEDFPDRKIKEKNEKIRRK